MKTRNLSVNTLLVLACLSLFTFCKKSTPQSEETKPTTNTEEPEKQTANLPYTAGIRIAWDYNSLKKISQASGYNGYARLIQLADKSLICTYESGGSIVVVKSADKGVTWSTPVVVDAKTSDVNMAVPDILQLKDGSILVCYNPRPFNIAPGRNFAIRTKKSYDGGLSWTDARLLYEADYISNNGCWEPAAIQLPSGEIQLFFANEGVYRSSNEQNISMVRSTDNGLTWSAAQIASFRAGSRDGMPTPLLLKNGKDIVFAIEDNGFTDFKPYIIRNALTDNWATPVTASSDKRSYALTDKLADNIYAGAPYLRQLSTGETILSYQGTDDRTVTGTDKLAYAEQKIAIGNDEALAFNRKSVPFNIPANKSGLWNSVNVIDDNVVIALTSSNGLSSSGATEVWMIKGYVIPQLNALNQKITIDGKTDEAAWSATFPIFVGHKSLTNAKANITYDNDNLYVLTNVMDAGINNPADTEEGDGVSVYVSNKTQTYSQPGAGVFRVFVGANNKVVVKEGSNGNWLNRDAATVKTMVSTVSKNYMQEIAIPWALLGGKPAVNSTIGFNLGLTENSGGAFAAQKETIDASPELKPNTWMTLVIK